MRLRLGIARDGFLDLPRWSSGWQATEELYYEQVASAGFEAVQGGAGELCLKNGLLLLGNGVIRRPQEAQMFADSWAAQGALMATCIAGTGYESDHEADRLIVAIADAARAASMPIHIETHRASITQDIWRTLRLLERHPEVRINADWSHWFTGLEMLALDWDAQLSRVQPVMDRAVFLHGRVGDRCCMQVALDAGPASVQLGPFHDLWVKTFERILHQATATVWFVPELLGTTYAYARVLHEREEGDRWRDALLLRDVARECFEAAKMASSLAP